MTTQFSTSTTGASFASPFIAFRKVVARSLSGTGSRAGRGTFRLRLMMAVCAVVLAAFSPNPGLAQQINFPSFNGPQAAPSYQLSDSCPTATNILFCINYFGQGPSFLQDFYPSYIDPSAATDGNAGSTNYALQLTQNAAGQTSSVWYVTPQDVVGGFTTWYTVKIKYQGGGDGNTADGLAFVIQKAVGGMTDAIASCPETGLGPTVLGNGGGCIGYGGIDNSVALEMDTFFDSYDPQQLSNHTSYSDNHLALQSCGLDGNGNPIANSPAHLGTPNCLLTLGTTSTLITSPVTSVTQNFNPVAVNLSDGNPHQVVMVYNGPNDLPANYLWVYLDATYDAGTHNPIAGTVPLFSGPFDITKYMKLSNGGASYSPAYVGFTAATGGDYEQHELMGWTFASHLNQPNFGNINVCPSGATTPAPCSKVLNFTYNFPNGATLGAPRVVTQGVAGLDFTLNPNSTTCIGNVAPGSCTVSVTFAPIAPGARLGAVNVVDNTGNLVASTLIYGVGQGPAVAFNQGALSTVNTGSYSLSQPKGLATDAAGNLYIADTGVHSDGNRNILKVATNGTVTALGSGLHYPQGIAVDGAGNLYAADNDLNQVIKIPVGCTSTTCQQVLPTPPCVLGVNGSGLCAELGVAVDGPGNVFIASFNSEVLEIPANGGAQIVVYNPVGSKLTGLAVDAAGDLFIADDGLTRIVEIPAGCASAGCQLLVGSGWNQPVSVAVDAAGDVFVADTGLQQVVEVPAGCASVGCQVVLASGIVTQAVTVDAAGNVFADNLSTNTIVEISRSQPPTLNFQSTIVGSVSSDSPQSVTLQNIGNQPLSPQTPGLILVGGAPSFASVPGPGLIPDCSTSSSIASGAACNLSVRFRPQGVGTYGSVAVFHDNALNSAAGVQVINLYGSGSSATYTIGGSVSGLTGSGLVLLDNLSNGVAVSGDGFFAFPITVGTGTSYSVTVFNQPAGQTCTVANGTGTVQSGNVTTVQVSCVNLVNYALTVTAPGTGAGTVTDGLGQISCALASGSATGACSGSYLAGTPVTLTANASTPAVFVGWGGACSGSGASPICILTINSALNVSASFVAPPATPPGALQPITAGVVYGQGGSFTSNIANNGGLSAGSLGNSQGMLVDSTGNLYVADGANNRVLFYPAGSTTPTRVYGQGGSFTSNATGTTANSLNNPQGIAVDSGGNVYISDESNSRVLYYPAGTTTATRVYGQGGSFTSAGANNGGISANSLYTPVGIALDKTGNLYVADYGNSRVLFYPAGSTTATQVYGQGGSFTSNTPNNGGISANSLNQALAVALDNSGDLYVADIYNNRVLFYPANSTTATQVYGQGGSFNAGIANNGGVNNATLNNPLAVAVDSSNGLYIVDRSNNRVLYYPFGTTGASRVYGQGGNFNASTQNGGGITANSLSQPWSVAVGASGNPYIADYGNSRVLGFGSFGNVNACPANQTAPAPCNSTVTYSYAPVVNTAIGATQVVTQGAPGLDFSLAGNTCTGTITEGTTCNVNVTFAPLAPGLRMGSVQLYDNAANLIASTPAYGVGQEPQIAFGPAMAGLVPFNANVGPNVLGVAADAAGNLYLSDSGNSQVLKLTPGGVHTAIPLPGGEPAQLTVDGAGNLLIVDIALGHVTKVAPGGVQTTLATPGYGSSAPGSVAVDGAGNVFLADYANGRILEVLANGGSVVPVATGLATISDLAVDASGQVFLAGGTTNVSTILKIVNGALVEVPTGTTATKSVAVNAAGDVYVLGTLNSQTVVVEVRPDGTTTTIASFSAASGFTPQVIRADASGNILVAGQSASTGVVLRITRSQAPALTFATTNVGSTSADSPQTVTVENIGNQPLTGSLALNLGPNFMQNSATDCSAKFPLAPGAICGESFSFTPQSATFLPGTATFTDNSLNASPLATQTFALSGTGAISGVAGTVAVPNVVGQTQTAAAAPFAGVGLTLGSVSIASSPTVPVGSIISENPVAGTQVAVGSVVNLLVSSGIVQPVSPNPLMLENNYFVTGDYVSAGVTLRATGTPGGMATGSITILPYTQSATQGIPDGADVVDAFLYWETIENTPFASSANGKFNGYPITGQQIGNDLPNFTDGQFNGTVRAYRASVNAYLPVQPNGIRIASGTYTVSLPDGKTALPITEGAGLVLVYRVLSPNFPLKSVVIYDGAAAPAVPGAQVVQGFYDAVGGAGGTGKSTNLYASGGVWSNIVNSVSLGKPNQYSAPLSTGSAYAAVILSTPVNNSDNDGILDAWKAGPTGSDFHAGQPGYYDAKTSTWVGLPGAKHGQKDLFVQLDYMCGGVLANGACDPTKENLFPSPDASGNDPLVMVQQAFANSGVQLHLQIGNIVPEDTCTDSTQLCQFPNQPGVVGWKNSLEFSKLYPRNVYACITGGDCTTRYPYGQKDSYHYVLMGHSLAIPAWNTRYGTLTSINVVSGVTTIKTVDRGNGINFCPGRITLGGVIGNPSLNGVYNTTSTCPDSKTIIVATPGVPNWSYPNATLPEPVIGLTSGTISSISGYSDLGGADSAVTLGLWLTAPNQDMSKKANVLAGTIFHEIGHTLGLSHGGLYYDGTANSYVPTFEANCKPNYQSIMNYLFQLDGVGPNQAIAFSNQTLNTLNENLAGSVTSLTDGSGNPATFPTSAWYVPYTTGSPVSPATRHCDGTPLTGDSSYRVDASIAPITPPWLNGQDLDFIGTLQPAERGFNDLTNMDLRQVGATGGEFASLATVLSFGASVAPLNIGANGNVTLGSGGTITLGSGGNVTLGSGGNVTLGSGGTITLGSGGNVTLGSGGNVTLGSGGTITLGSGGNVTLGSGGNVTLGSGGNVTLGSGGTITLGKAGMVTFGGAGTVSLGGVVVTVVSGAGGAFPVSAGGTITLGSGGTITLGSGGNVTLGSGGTITLGSGGNVTLGSGGNVTLGSGGTITMGSGGTITLGSGGNVTLGSGGTITLGSGGTITLGSGGNVTLGSGGTVTLGSGGNLTSGGAGGNVTLGSGGEATLAAGGTITLGSGGNVTLGSGGNVTLGSGGTITLGSGGNITLGSGGNATVGAGGNITLGSGGTITLGSGGSVSLSSGGTITDSTGTTTVPAGGGNYSVGAGGTITLGSGGNITLGSGGNITLGSGGTITLGSGGNITLGSGGNVTLGSGGTITLGSGGTITLGSGGTITLGSGGVVTLGTGGSVIEGIGSTIGLGSVNNITPASGGPLSANELTYETANSVVRPPSLPTQTTTPAGVRINWTAPAFGVVQTYTIYRSSNGATPIVIGSVSGVNGNPPATEFTDTNPDTTSATVVYTVTTTLVPDAAGPPRQSVPSPPAVLKNDQSIVLGPLPSSALVATPVTVTATALSNGTPNGLQVAFSAIGSCTVGSQSIASGVSSAIVTSSVAGSCTVTAAQLGTTSYNAANSVSGIFMVLAQGSTTKSQTITFPLLPNAQYGGSFSLSASSTSGQSVIFTSSGPCTTSGGITGMGVCSITASVPAANGFSAASLTQSFTIYPAVLKVTATNLSTPYGQPLPSLLYTYSGFVKGSTSSVDTASVISGAPALTTTATAASNVGSYPITVSTGTLATTNYSFLYVTGTLTVQAANQAPLILKSTSPLTFNQSETLSATGGTTGGVVTYSLVNGPCALTGSKLTAMSGTGSCLVTATMAGSGNYNSVTSTPASSVGLGLASQTITFTTNPPASAAYRSSFVVAATSGSGGVVSFSSSGACSNSGATFTITNSVGACSVIANQAGSANYAAAPTVTKTVIANGPVLTLSTSNLNFGTVYQGSISVQLITLTNSGTAAMSINDPILSIVRGGNSNEFVALSLCPRSLAAGRNCTVLIGFIAGPYYTPQTATLQIMDNSPGGPHPITMSATVINPQARLNSTSLSFGTIRRATTSTQSVVLSNPGGTPLSLTSISVTGVNATSFVQSNTCGTSLAAGGNCIIAVKFTPAAVGTFKASLTIVDNAQNGSTQTVPLSGTGN